MHCGYLNRNGEFIDCSHEKNEYFKHESYCDAIGIDEDYLLTMLGWIKLTTCLPNAYITYRALSDKQVKWSTDNGYDIEEEDK